MLKLASILSVGFCLAGCDKAPFVSHEVKCDLATVPLGTSRDEVLRLCGKPDRINVTRIGDGAHEQWAYDGFHAYLYVDNNRLTSTQY